MASATCPGLGHAPSEWRLATRRVRSQEEAKPPGEGVSARDVWHAARRADLAPQPASRRPRATGASRRAKGAGVGVGGRTLAERERHGAGAQGMGTSPPRAFARASAIETRSRPSASKMASLVRCRGTPSRRRTTPQARARVGGVEDAKAQPLVSPGFGHPEVEASRPQGRETSAHPVGARAVGAGRGRPETVEAHVPHGVGRHLAWRVREADFTVPQGPAGADEDKMPVAFALPPTACGPLAPPQPRGQKVGSE
jgi:hypothetical protein